jgi:hypothetical protein
MALSAADAAAMLPKIRAATGSPDLERLLSAQVSGDLLSLGGITASASELNLLDGMTATAAELNQAADRSAYIQELTASGAVTPGIRYLELNHATVAIAATIASVPAHAGIFVVKDTSASGTAAHTVTLTGGTWNGTNTIATLNAPGEMLVVYFDSAGGGSVIVNLNAVGLS